jgi:hypothetical protein
VCICGGERAARISVVSRGVLCGWVVVRGREGGGRCLVFRCGRWVWRGGCEAVGGKRQGGREDGEAGANCGRGVALALWWVREGRPANETSNKRQAPTICLRLLHGRMMCEVSLDFASHVMYTLTRQHVMHSWILMSRHQQRKFRFCLPATCNRPAVKLQAHLSCASVIALSAVSAPTPARDHP